MKVAIIYNKDIQGVINTFGMQNKEFYSEDVVKRVAKSLESAGHNVSILDGNKHIIERLENFMPRVIDGEQMGMVFNMAYGIQGESRYTHIPSMLEMLGIPYVGSSPSGHALALDKVLTKVIWKNHNIPTPEYWVFSSSNEDLSPVKFPVIVKPKMESVSFGLKIGNNTEDLKEAIDFVVNEFNQQALVEQFIRGREFCVGLIGNSPIETFPVLEIDLDNDPEGIQTNDDKKKKPKEKICPANISPELAKEMQKISKEAFRVLNLRDFARVDIRLDENNNIHLLEINSMASLGHTGSYITAAKVAGYDFTTLVNRMLDVASVRYFATSLLSQLPEENKKGKVSKIARMRSFIKARQQQNEKFLKKIIDINTYVRNIEGVNQCSEHLSAELSKLGFSREIYPQIEVGNNIFFSNTSNKEIDFLLLLNIDNKINLQNHENYHEHEQYLEGSGIWENKGGLAIVISALQTLRFTRNLKKIKIGVLVISDSGIDGKYSKDLIRKKTESASHVIAFSGSSKSGGLILSRSGSAQYHLEMRMIKKGSPENISSTAMNFSKTLAAITDLSRNDNENVIAPFNIEFKSNIFKDFAYGSAGISVRYNSKETLEEIEQRIQKIISQQKRSKIYQLHFEGGKKRSALQSNQLSEDFYKKIHAITKKIDVRISKEHRWSSSDICHINKELPIIDGLGPVGEFLLSGNERILRHSIQERALLLAMILLQI